MLHSMSEYFSYHKRTSKIALGLIPQGSSDQESIYDAYVFLFHNIETYIGINL